MNKLVLEKLIENNYTQRKIGEKLNISQSSVRYWLKKYGLKTKTKTENKEHICRFCNETDKELFALRHGKYCLSICQKCDNERSSNRARNNKLKAVIYKGGKCSNCGYNKNIAALEFHHLDSRNKDPSFNKMKFWNFDKIKKELDKCDLVCSNCHREKHNPNATMMYWLPDSLPTSMSEFDSR